MERNLDFYGLHQQSLANGTYDGLKLIRLAEQIRFNTNTHLFVLIVMQLLPSQFIEIFPFIFYEKVDAGVSNLD